MPRRPKPWRRADAGGAWYAWVNRAQQRLADPEASFQDAQKVLYEILAGVRRGPAPESAGIVVGELIALYLTDVGHRVREKDLAPLSGEFYRRHLGPFAERFGDLEAAGLRPHQVTDWLRGKGWNATTRRGAIASIKAAFSWARKQGRIATDPVKQMDLPPAGRRQHVLGPDQARAILEAIPDEAFRDLLTALWMTGARPSEVAEVTAADFDPAAAVWTLRAETSGEGSPLRVILLTPEVAAISRRLAARWPTGPLFRNARGRPWTRNAMACRFARLRAKLGMGKEATADSFRHLFVTDALEAGVPIAQVAELAGHTSTAMVSRHYSHLRDRRQHLRGELLKVRGGRGPGVPDPPSPEPPANPDPETVTSDGSAPAG